MNPQVFREYDIRGVVEDDFDDDFIVDLGRAYATMLIEAGKNTMTLGRDCRLSSDALRDLLIEGLLPCRNQRRRRRRGADAAAVFFGTTLENGRRCDDHRQPQCGRV